MGSANLTMGVKGVDKTGAAFNSIKARAKVTGLQIKSMLGGALAFAGVGLGLKGLSDTISNLGKLSDLAMKTGASVEDLTRMTTAFQVAGLDIGVETLAKSFQYLEKNTGRKGSEGFFKTVEEIAKIEDPAKRGAEMVKNFGRSGMELAPLINGGEEAVRKFRELASLMPGVSTAAANAGDDIADAQTVLGKGVQSLWMKVVGKVCALWGEDFPGGVRAGALNAINYVEHFCKMSLNRLTKWGAKAGLAIQAVWNWAANGYSWEQAWNEYDEVSEILSQQSDAELKQIDKARQDYVDKLAKASVDDLANVFGKRKGVGLSQDLGGTFRSPNIRNDLIAGGSNAASRLQILGPSLQSEQKKTNALLEQVVENTKQTADNTEEKSGEEFKTVET